MWPPRRFSRPGTSLVAGGGAGFSLQRRLEPPHLEGTHSLQPRLKAEAQAESLPHKTPNPRPASADRGFNLLELFEVRLTCRTGGGTFPAQSRPGPAYRAWPAQEPPKCSAGSASDPSRSWPDRDPTCWSEAGATDRTDRR